MRITKDFEQVVRPNYENGSIVNLMSSLVLGLGGRPSPYAPLELLQPQAVFAAANVVLLVIDGLGYNYLQRHQSAFDKHLQGRITSVFPSSTAPAITTFFTGVAPQQHAVSGWFMNLRELGTVMMILPFCSRWGGGSFTSAHVNVEDLIARPSLFNTLNADSYFVIDRRLVDSPYTKAAAGCAKRKGYGSLDECLACVQVVLKEGPRRKFVYVYWPLLDALSHHYGVGSKQVEAHFRELEQGFADLLAALSGTDTLVIATADHGFIDTAAGFTTRLEEHPVLADCLSVPLCGEPRVAYCYVRAGKAAAFERYVTEQLSDCFTIYPSKELVQAGWFGLGEPEPRLLERLGDYVLITKERYVIKDSLVVEGRWADVGVHGGASEDEMYVPLIVSYC